MSKQKFLLTPDMLRELRKATEAAGSVAAFARQNELSPSTVWSILNGVRPVTWLVARILGYTPVRVYRKRDPS